MSSDNNWASYLDDGEEAYQKNPFQPGSSEPPTELKFFMFSDPAETRTADNKKLVRSHVARTSHAKSRHARNSKRGQAQPRNQAALEGARHGSGEGPQSSHWNYHPSFFAGHPRWNLKLG